MIRVFFIHLLLLMPVFASEPTADQREAAFVERHGVPVSPFTTSDQIKKEIIRVGNELRDAVVAFDLNTCVDPASGSENDRAKAQLLAVAVKTKGKELGLLLVLHRRLHEHELAKQGWDLRFSLGYRVHS